MHIIPQKTDKKKQLLYDRNHRTNSLPSSKASPPSSSVTRNHETISSQLQGVSAFLFGYADQFSSDPSTITALWLTMRVMQGAGAAGCNLAIFSMVADRFADRLGQVMGLNEVYLIK
jgi:hypothetical protein